MLEQQIKDFLGDNKLDFLPSSQKYSNLPLSSIVLPQNHPRRYFDYQRLEKLAKSIQEHGILEPLIVRPFDNLNSQYELVAGVRRYQAAKLAGCSEVTVCICHLNNSEALAISLCENLQREDLNPLEETEGILSLLSLRLQMDIPDVISLLYRMRNHPNQKVSQNVLTKNKSEIVKTFFTSLGKISWQSFITSRLPLLKLPEDIIQVLRQGQIAYTKAKVLSSVKDQTLRQTLTEDTINQNLSLSQLRKKIKQLNDCSESLPTWEDKAKLTFQSLIQSRVWENPNKKKQAEELLFQLQQLISEDF